MGRRGGWKQCGFRHLESDQGSWADDAQYKKGVTWCGKAQLFSEADRAMNLRLVTCNKCSQAIGKHKLARVPRRVRLEALEKPLGYMRSTYALHLDGAHLGFIQIASGWGVKWQANCLADDHGYTSYGFGEIRSVGTDDYYKGKDDLRRNPDNLNYHDAWPVHFASKEAMAVAMLALYDRRPDAFPTQAMRDAATAKRKADDAACQLELEASRAERARLQAIADRMHNDRLEAWSLAYVDLAARVDLTNLERAGLEAARALIGKPIGS